jgi:hypothetical protein
MQILPLKRESESCSGLQIGLALNPSIRPHHVVDENHNIFLMSHLNSLPKSLTSLEANDTTITSKRHVMRYFHDSGMFLYALSTLRSSGCIYNIDGLQNETCFLTITLHHSQLDQIIHIKNQRHLDFKVQSLEYSASALVWIALFSLASYEF